MLLTLFKHEIVLILNCINYTMYMLSKNDNSIGRRELMNYFDINNFGEDYSKLLILHGRISTSANKYFYKLSNDNFFIDQKKYLTVKKDCANK